MTTAPLVRGKYSTWLHIEDYCGSCKIFEDWWEKSQELDGGLLKEREISMAEGVSIVNRWLIRLIWGKGCMLMLKVH